MGQHEGVFKLCLFFFFYETSFRKLKFFIELGFKAILRTLNKCSYTIKANVSFVIAFSWLRLISKQSVQMSFTMWVYYCPYMKKTYNIPWYFSFLDKEKGGSLTVNDFEIAAKYGE